jgi:hypothetical protein
MGKIYQDRTPSLPDFPASNDFANEEIDDGEWVDDHAIEEEVDIEEAEEQYDESDDEYQDLDEWELEAFIVTQASVEHNVDIVDMLAAVAWLPHPTVEGNDILYPCLNCINYGWVPIPTDGEIKVGNAEGRCTNHIDCDDSAYRDRLQNELIPGYVLSLPA